jgi:UDP-N-acetylglucosamine--N-acetylmuramyl-(pentapeptide) pyrophosphoryl-undecaprenol N-acetylglucosamine transferase
LNVPDWLHVVPYIEDMPRLLPLASLAVSRAGAMATSEFLAAGLPSLLMPLPTAAAGHQTKNAEALEAAGTAIVADEAGTSAEALWRILTDLLSDEAELASMAAAALSRARPSAALDIAADLAGLLPPMRGGTS